MPTPRPRDLTLAAVLADLAAHPPRLRDGDHAAIAGAAHAMADLPGPFPTGVQLAEALDLVVVRSSLLSGCCHGSLFADTILVRHEKTLERESVAALHEVSHQRLDAGGREYSHGDVWLVTFCLAVPRDRIALARATKRLPFPAWVVALRDELERVVLQAA